MRLCFILFFLISFTQLVGQTNKEKAQAKCDEAIKLMDSGKIAESIALLEEAIKLDPDNAVFPYEMGFAYYQDKNYQKAIDINADLIKQKRASDNVYQMMGNSYDLLGKREKAIKTYEAGLDKYPKSGKLHLELGGMYQANKEFDKAIQNYEAGIDGEPDYSSNYYRLAKLYLSSEEEVWGMIYGELFMNLERNSNRTAEISKMLFDTYKSEIKFPSDTSCTISFSKFNIIALDKKKLDIPYGMGVYEPTLILAVASEKNIDLASLNRIRISFISTYFTNKFSKKYPNALFDYHQKVIEAGHGEAYNYWILMKGNEAEFNLWQIGNGEKWESFVDWFNPNPIKLDDKNKFLRTQY